MVKFFRKYHKWLGIGITVFILLFALSGIVLNHRDWFSGVNVPRSLLPEEYHYKNWNNGAVRGTLTIGPDSVLVYGNIGIWLTDSTASRFKDFNRGFPNGIDHRKISTIYKTSSGSLFAGSLFGLYQFNTSSQEWQRIELPIHEPRICDITEKQDTLLVLGRSYLLSSVDHRNFSVLQLPKSEDYYSTVGLFKTLWVIHSGEILGIVGKLLVDMLGIVFIFLSITGLIYFINPYLIKRYLKRNRDIQPILKSSRWNLKWHNNVGWIAVFFLLITTLTGMFLRPPLLIAIATSKVAKIPYTILDSPNPWFDKLRRIDYNPTTKQYIIATRDGIYYTHSLDSDVLKKFKPQVPMSLMGVNVFEPFSDASYLIGSFSGLFDWDMRQQTIRDAIKNTPYSPPKQRDFMIGEQIISGYSSDFQGGPVFFDYRQGVKRLGEGPEFPVMPDIIKDQPMSLWHLSLEIHVGRFYRFLFGPLSGFFVFFSGLIIGFILISGFVVWYKLHR